MYVRAGTRNRTVWPQHYDIKHYKSIPCWAAFVCVVVGGGRGNLAEPDPYAGGEGLVTCYTQSL